MELLIWTEAPVAAKIGLKAWFYHQVDMGFLGDVQYCFYTVKRLAKISIVKDAI